MDKKEELKQIKELWQFYTNPMVVLNVVNILLEEMKWIIDFNKTIFIEPSAWTWSFINVIKNLKYNIEWYDIMPKHKDIIKQDFLNIDISKLPRNNIVIWNPPFWKRSKLAIDFFNRSAEFSDIIAFIVPNQFKKYSVHNKLNKEFKLIKEVWLEKNAFFTNQNEKYDVNCVFQIWVRNNISEKKNLRIINKPIIVHDDFEMYQYNNTEKSLKIFNNEFDFGVFSQWYWDYNKKYYNKDDFNLKKQRLLFKAKNKKVLKNLQSLNFEELSTHNTTVPWFRKWDVVKEYIRIFN